MQCLKQFVRVHISSHNLVEMGLEAVSLLLTSIADSRVSFFNLADLNREVRIDLSFAMDKAVKELRNSFLERSIGIPFLERTSIPPGRVDAFVVFTLRQRTEAQEISRGK